MPAEPLLPYEEDGEIGFSYAQDDKRLQVAVEFFRQQDKTYWQQFVSSRLLNYYVGPFSTGRVDGQLKRLKLYYLKVTDDNFIDSAFVETVIENHANKEGPPKLYTTPLLLRCPSAAVLVVLRTHTAAPDGNSRPREFVAFVQEPRRAVSQGYPDSPEIPCGRFGPDQHLQGKQIKAIEEQCNILLVRGDLNQLVNRLGNNWGMNTSMATASDNVELYLYRKTISESDLQKMQAAASAEKPASSSPISVHLIPLGIAWRSTTDLKSLAALFFFHEYRYHNTMPKYTPPSGYIPPPRPSVPAAPKWTKIKDINPSDSGVNVVAKVHKGLEKSGGVAPRRGLIVIGDETGIVGLSLSQSQMGLGGLGEEGEPVALRNANVDTSGGVMKFYVSTWGKILTGSSIPPELDFSFEVNSSNDMSSVTYEMAAGGGGSGPRRQLGGGGRSPFRGGARGSKPLRGRYGGPSAAVVGGGGGRGRVRVPV